MTIEQVRRTVVEKLTEELSGRDIHDRVYDPATLRAVRIGTLPESSLDENDSLDAQCRRRFGLDWAGIRSRVIEDLDRMAMWNNHVASMIVESTSGHWMINRLWGAWLLREMLRKEKLEFPSNYHGGGGRLDMQRTLDEVVAGKRELNAWVMFYIAPVLCPEEAQAIVESHGMTV